MEKTILQGKSLAICKLDVEKAFDTLDHNSILRMMMARNMPEQLIRAVLVEYLNCSVNMHLDNRELCNIKVWRGVKQGSPLSALIFQFVVDWTQSNSIKRWRLENTGASVSWADDSDIMQSSTVKFVLQMMKLLLLLMPFN